MNGSFTVPGTSRVPLIVGALAPAMCRLGGELADGVTTWLAGPRSLEQVVVPAVTEGAEAGGRPPPRVLAGIPVAVDDDPDRARSAVDRIFGRYGTLVNYRRLFEREGVDGPTELAITGDSNAVSMPVLNIVCPDCWHEYRSLVVEGAKVPTVWVCPECAGRRAEVAAVLPGSNHPWAGGSMDACCG